MKTNTIKHIITVSVVIFFCVLSIGSGTQQSATRNEEDREQAQYWTYEAEAQRIKEAEAQNRRNQILDRAKRLTNSEDIKIVELGHIFSIPNPYAFDKNILYHAGNGLFVWQWIERSFLGSFLPKENTYPYDIEFFVRTVPNITKVGQRISNVYMIYIGTQTFEMANGSSRVFAVFDLLDFDS